MTNVILNSACTQNWVLWYINSAIQFALTKLDIPDLKCLECMPPQLEVLCLHGNPVCELEAEILEKKVLEVLLHLKEMDWKRVTPSME